MITKYIKLFIFWLLAALVVACSDSDAPSSSSSKVTSNCIGIDVDAQGYTFWESSRAEGDTKVSVRADNIGVYGYMKDSKVDAVFDNQPMYYVSGTTIQDVRIPVDVTVNNATIPANTPLKEVWSLADYNSLFAYYADPTWIAKLWEDDMEYLFFAYSPYIENGAVVNTDDYQTKLAANYDNFTTFIWPHIPPVSKYDYMVSTSVQRAQSTYRPQFNLTHLMSRICFCYKLGEEYAKIRSIKVKKVEVSGYTTSGTLATYYQCTAKLPNIGDNDFEVSMESTGTSYVSDDGIDLIPIFDDPNGLALNADAYQEFGSLYVAMNGLRSIYATVTYDVYDTAKEITRVNQVSKNRIDFSFSSLEMGKYYDINIIVSPAYLYVLSDNDVPPDLVLDPE
ncbi:MAG: fimbrillin family protein [Bacteroidales bacterium]|nr:fimbrillin family protein [Bacteroidales bacterium]